jgi:amidohydrolase
MPNQTVDAVVVAAQIIVALQTIVARNVDPEDTAVVSIGSIQAGNAGNVIAETAVMRGTIRSFTPESKALLRRRVPEIAMGIAAALGATATVEIGDGVDATVSAPAPTQVVYEAAAAVLGAENIDTTYRTTGGEDFSAVLARVPGNFFFLGARFDIDERCLPQGVAILCEAARQVLQGKG